jgi:hypothetical protein
MADVRDFVGAIQGGRIVPKDAFSHAFTLVDIGTSDDVKSFSAILEKHILLANLGDDKKIRLYQTDIVLLTNLYDMQLREPLLYAFFKQMYYGWKGEIAITRTKDGLERKLQATAGKGYAPRNDMVGYGDMLADLERQESSLFEKLTQRFTGGNQNQNQNQQPR